MTFRSLSEKKMPANLDEKKMVFCYHNWSSDREKPLDPVLFEIHTVRDKGIKTLLTAERIWFKCDLYLRFIPPINLWKVCIDLRPFPKYFNEPFLRTLRSPKSNNLEIQNNINSK